MIPVSLSFFGTFVVISLVIMQHTDYVQCTSTMSLKEFYDMTNWNAQHTSPFKAKFTHEEIIQDHKQLQTQIFTAKYGQPGQGYQDESWEARVKQGRGRPGAAGGLTGNDNRIASTVHSRGSKFTLPKTNFRILTVHAFRELKTKDLDQYRIQWDKEHAKIVAKQFTVIDEPIRALELKFLQEYDVYPTCTWYYPLPPPFDRSKQCMLEELEAVWPKMDQLMNIKPNKMSFVR